MATIDSREIVADIIAGKYADDDPRRIVEYTNAFGKTTWGVTFGREDHNKYLRPSEYVQNPRVIWDAA